MTANGKLLKIFCLAALFAGIASLVCGFVLVAGSLADVDAWVTAGEGIGAALTGARSAILANVPSNTSKIKTISLVATLVAVAGAAFMLFGGQDVQVAQIALAVALCVIAVAAFVIAAQIVKEQLRK